MTTHPMDDIPVRRLKFRFDDVDPSCAMWSQSSPLFSLFSNALTVHVPYFERYLIRALGAAKRKLPPSKLRDDVEAIIGQEGDHANSFIAYNDLLKRRYPGLEKLERESSDGFVRRLKEENFKTQIGFTAGYETFTFLAGMIFLDNYDKWFADSHPGIKALWVWHQVEEVEHGAVAFDVYQHFFAEDELFRKKMVLAAFWHIVTETAKAYLLMCKAEGYFDNPIKVTKAIAFLLRVLGQMMWASRPVLIKTYHPRRHPLVTTRQNPIAVSWRRFHKAGGDVLEIDRAKMEEIMGIPSQASH